MNRHTSITRVGSAGGERVRGVRGGWVWNRAQSLKGPAPVRPPSDVKGLLQGLQFLPCEQSDARVASSPVSAQADPRQVRVARLGVEQ